jgi:F-type H+-transporting ATPase subunit gamma
MAESLASENAVRLASMQGAEKDIEDKLAELHTVFHQQRQMSITEGLLDIVAGFEALESEVGVEKKRIWESEYLRSDWFFVIGKSCREDT